MTFTHTDKSRLKIYAKNMTNLYCNRALTLTSKAGHLNSRITNDEKKRIATKILESQGRTERGELIVYVVIQDNNEKQIIEQKIIREEAGI